MDPKILLRALLPGLAPVLVFVAIDALFGEVVGCIVGLAVGVGELVWSLVKTRKADPFVIVDTALLAAACGLSLLLKDETFFKLKPAVIEAVLGIGLAAFLVLPPAALTGYVSRHMRGITIPDSAIPAMQRSLGLMLGVLALHAGLTVWAALAWSTAAWGFVSGVLLYILFGAIILAQFVSTRLGKGGRAARRAPRGGLPVIDDEGKVIRIADAADCHRGPGTLHPAVRLIITDGEGRLYLRKHPASNEPDPDKWETAIAAHVPANETVEMTLARELGRQLGIVLPPPASGQDGPKPILRYKWEDAVESELELTFIYPCRDRLTPNGRDGADARFWTQREIRENIGKGVFTPRFELELGLIDRAAAEARKRG